MHKGVVLVVRADNKKEAKSEAEVFMEGQVNNVCDWYVIGGRRSGLLSKGDNEDIVKLDRCIGDVKKYKGTGRVLHAKIENARERLVETRAQRLSLDNVWWTLDAYRAKKYSDLVYGDFSFESNVFNVDTQDDKLPEEDYYKDYYAVVIDMHN